MAELPSDMREHNRKVIDEFRANKGAGDRQLLLLTTTGARSGLPRTTPMMYIPDGEHLLVMASNAGAPTHPDWYRNLVASPRVTVEVGPETYDANAVVTEGDERERLWRMIVERYPFFADDQAKINRQIPIVALERVGSA